MELQRRSSGVAKAGMTTGIIGSGLGLLNSLALMGVGVNAATRNAESNGCGNWNGACGGVPQTVVINANDDNNRRGRGYYDDGGCSENHLVNRYELGLQQSNAAKDSEIALLKANTYNDQKTIELYKYVDGRFQEFERELARQAVVNQKTADSFEMVAKDVQCCCDRLQVQIDRERDERKCADNTIITYTNATFYPKRVANVTTDATATTPQDTYNPLPCNSGCNCNR